MTISYEVMSKRLKEDTPEISSIYVLKTYVICHLSSNYIYLRFNLDDTIIIKVTIIAHKSSLDINYFILFVEDSRHRIHNHNIFIVTSASSSSLPGSTRRPNSVHQKNEKYLKQVPLWLVQCIFFVCLYYILTLIFHIIQIKTKQR